ncbi:hypothetical protein ACTFTM_30065 [Micromonospora sp. RB23]
MRTGFNAAPRFRAILAAVVLAAVAAVTPVLAMAEPARAATDCRQPRILNGEGAATVDRSFYLRTAPESACPNANRVTAGSRVYYYCYYFNQYGNMWWYVRIAGTNQYGWLSDSDITDIFEYDDDGDGNVEWLGCNPQSYLDW